MSNQLGFLVVNQRTGYVTAGKDHAAKIFSNRKKAQSACRPMHPEIPVPQAYSRVASSLLLGQAFCFDDEEGHNRFLAQLRNDPANKPFMAYSRDRNYIKWRHEKAEKKPGIDASVAPNAPVQPVPAQDAPVAAPVFNASILVR